jgi:germination protein M
MTKRFICVLAVVVLAICLISGGCTPQNNSKMADWRNLLKVTPQPTDKADKGDSDSQAESQAETTEVELYFVSSDEGKLVFEKRAIPKVQGIARRTLEELLKGPKNTAFTAIAPAGTRLLDINLKPDGLCIVDLSSEARQVESQQQAEVMIQAIANTLGQFSTIDRVTFMIDGEAIDSLGDYAVSHSVEPDYSF